MARSRALGDIPVTYPRDSRKWTASHGTEIAGRAYLDEADLTASQMEGKWGADRLRLLVGPELREKFDRQRYKLNHVIWNGDLEDVKREAMRMVKAWIALDKAATEAGKPQRSPDVLEIPLKSGVVAAIVADITDARQVVSEGRRVAVYTFDDIGRMLSDWSTLNAVKVTFPGSTVMAVPRSVFDPLDGIHDTKGDIDDDMPF